MEVTSEEDIIKLATKDSAVDMEASAVVDTREDTMQLSTIKVSAVDTREVSVDTKEVSVDTREVLVDTREVSVDTREVSAAVATREVSVAADTTREVSAAVDSVDTREVSTDK